MSIENGRAFYHMDDNGDGTATITGWDGESPEVSTGVLAMSVADLIQFMMSLTPETAADSAGDLFDKLIVIPNDAENVDER